MGAIYLSVVQERHRFALVAAGGGLAIMLVGGIAHKAMSRRSRPAEAEFEEAGSEGEARPRLMPHDEP
jgi:hypothetical protein